jgi:SAM-dependent methyltransferase
MIGRWLQHPLTRGLDLDDPRTTDLRRAIIEEKRFLRNIYADWYSRIATALPPGHGSVLEIGSGAGFLAEFVPALVTSDLFVCPGVRVVLDALHLPFARGTLRGIVMTNVLHHVSEPRQFFSDALTCVGPGGVIAMIEPWVTPWSRLVYTHVHHEPFQPDAAEWTFPSTGPLSGANGALPWILFQRDRARFEREFPGWSIERIEPMMPFRYLVSGGVSLRNLTPEWTTAFWRGLERLMGGASQRMAMFALIILRKGRQTAGA